ncbi:MAG: ankyrin repeat domain-containing protein [Verrucomicrobiota bacterium]|nr:ankyrin repeat domain-containing protein [Verrucomicrobiota bacterium]
MKHLLLTTVAVVVVGCGESKQSAPTPESEPVETAAENTKPEPARVKLEHSQANHALIEATATGNVKTIKKAITDGADVNVKAVGGGNLLFIAAHEGHRKVAELLIGEGADVNETNSSGETPLDWAKGETADLLRKHGGKTGEELKYQVK